MNTPVSIPISMARKAGSLVFVSGQLALRDGQIQGNDIGTQTSLVIDAIAAQLARFDLALSDVVKTGVWLVSATDFGAFNTVYASRFAEPYPARSTVISALALPGALVEIDAIAHVRE